MENFYESGIIISAILTIIYFGLNATVEALGTGKSKQECSLPFELYFILTFMSWFGALISLILATLYYSKYKAIHSKINDI